MREELKHPGHTYFRYDNDSLFGSVEATLLLSACNFPIFRKDASLLEAAMKGEAGMKEAIDTTCIALSVQSEIAGHRSGGTIILTEEEQDKLILGILERRGRTAIARSGILDKIQAEIAMDGIEANTDAKSNICPAKDTSLPGDQLGKKEMTEEQARERLMKGVHALFTRKRGLTLEDLLKNL